MKKLVFCFTAVLSVVALVALSAFADDSAVSAVSALSTLPWYATALEYYMIITSVLGTAAIVATMTPTPKDDAVISKIQKFIHIVGLNFGFAKNKG